MTRSERDECKKLVAEAKSMGEQDQSGREPRSYENSKAKAKAYNTCRAPQGATATSKALVTSQAKLA